MPAKGVLIKTALISVFNKEGLVEFAQGLKEFKVRILSTGNTSRMLKDSGIRNDEVSDVTKFPEMLDGRVKTLHPKVHGGILARRDKREHMRTIARHRIPQIDLVVVDLYPFEEAVRSGKSRQQIIEMIDIGGPTMLRAAAKNHDAVAAVCSVSDYPVILKEMSRNKGRLSAATLSRLAAKVFAVTSHYDALITNYLTSPSSSLKERVLIPAQKKSDLRYGENPHQSASVYASSAKPTGLASVKVFGGKELSYNNYLDLDSAWKMVDDYKEPAACVVKHNNPCGFCIHKDIVKAFKMAHACDPLSAFGGIVGINRKIEAGLAKAIVGSGFLECVIAPGYTKEAIEVFRTKKNLRIVQMPKSARQDLLQIKQVSGAMLVQQVDRRKIKKAELKTVTRKKPTAKQMKDLIASFELLKHIKSNAIVIMKDGQASGIGMGQPSRVDSVLTAFRKSGKRAAGAVLASDGFFPKPDSIQVAAKAGIKAIIQPGGSIQDQSVIAAADKAGIAMVLTGHRHFTH